MKTVLVLQFFGLGDCIWAQSIAHHFIEKGYIVVWPVKDIYFEGLCRAYPQIKWVPESIVQPELFNIKEKIDLNGITVAPIRWSDSYMKLPYKDVMCAKYLMYDLQWQSWKNHAPWVRYFEKENDLYKLMGLEPGEKYNLINTNFGSGKERTIPISVSNGHKNVNLKVVPGFSLFDWAKIISEAEEIHTVSTSLLYMLEVMPLIQPIHIYVRHPVEKNLDFVRFLLTKNYTLHE